MRKKEKALPRLLVDLAVFWAALRTGGRPELDFCLQTADYSSYLRTKGKKRKGLSYALRPSDAAILSLVAFSLRPLFTLLFCPFFLHTIT